MNWFQKLLSNPFLLIGLSSWFWAQLIKTIIHAIVTKSIDFTRLIGDGGMPSGHSATVSSLATAAALVYGLGSFEFAMAFIFAIVVCKDAMGVRLETGRQAVIINDIVEAFNSLASEKIPEAKLKEFVGHTPLQVIAGILLGVVIGAAFGFGLSLLFERAYTRGHLIIVEQGAIVAGIRTQLDVEIEHPTGVSAYLVVTTVQAVFEGKLSTGVVFVAYHHALAVDHHAIGGQQFHIEHLTHVGGVQVVGANHVGFVPDGVANEVTSVVGVDVNLLLYLLVLAQTVLQRIEIVGTKKATTQRHP